MKKVVILGASRGFGQALATEIAHVYPMATQLLMSRKMSLPGIRLDLSRPDGQSEAWQQIDRFCPSHILYIAGGGPYGAFANKDLASHEWAIEVSFMAAMRLLHKALQAREKLTELRQFAVVGSAIAGSQPDPLAASYAAAKHALRGLIGSVAKEKPWFDVKLYEPGYMVTDMLPPNAAPRTQGLAVDPKDEAKKMLRFLRDSDLWLSPRN